MRRIRKKSVRGMAFDALALDAEGSRRRKDENGYLHISRTHLTKEQVAPYYGKEIPGWEGLDLDPERVYYGYRPAEELEKSADMFNGMPLLMVHQRDSAHAPLKEVRVGSVGTTPVWDAPYLDNALSVTDQVAIDAIEDKSLSEISCGYFYTPDFTPGEFNGVAYDFVMRDIRGNHVALVKDGRAGPDVCVQDAMPSKFKKVKKPMKLTRMQVAVRAALATALNPLLAQDAAPTDLTKLVGSYKKPSTLAKAVERKYSKLLAQDADLDAEELAEVIEAATSLVSADPESTEGDPSDPPAFDDDNVAESLRALLEGKVPDDLLEKLIACASAPAKDEANPEPGKPVVTGDDNPGDDPDNKDNKDAIGAMDANTIMQKATEQAMAKARSLTSAAAKVRPVCGELDAMAFDSAEAIFGHALKAKGVKVKNYTPAAYEGMVDMMMSQERSAMANDHALEPEENTELTGHFSHLANIKFG